jgi:transglutaminase-like putative cysteine protease
LLTWAQGFVRSVPTDTLSLLKDIKAAISAWISYQSRDEEGTQPPLATLDRGWGSCRDIAVLLIEAARRLGLGARIVSGYLAPWTESGGGRVGSADAGSTHAWAEIYLPGAGWVTFDPTNRTVGDFSLIPVAVARDIRQAVPVSGSFIGAPDDFLGMTVEVLVTTTGADPAAGTRAG